MLYVSKIVESNFSSKTGIGKTNFIELMHLKLIIFTMHSSDK